VRESFCEQNCESSFESSLSQPAEDNLLRRSSLLSIPFSLFHSLAYSLSKHQNRCSIVLDLTRVVGCYRRSFLSFLVSWKLAFILPLFLSICHSFEVSILVAIVHARNIREMMALIFISKTTIFPVCCWC